ncbi:rhamnogalacturonan acetylesterase [Flavilitoribacter nigricans]|uniref:GDSL family lipase n=1 Tax=Flavilitoribacter nigricans (strain ATCC 23147 / DSM 23189 / NBRC 102662 / NCIMB 1420 / SS-2) TaxID=1122177 RepID=A0A2D0NJH7_FLAN2|nr:rhamnogalacturonan acetylesterase [Flavilitoribacter nigricans]PHN08665.1 GDSL family lipase [Flavilitoribacter nigricans DSM 23189 = NBRC 102662]
MKTIFTGLIIASVLLSCQQREQKIIHLWLVGDSTMKDYSQSERYATKDYPMTGWGQVFPRWLTPDSLALLDQMIPADSVTVRNVARGGRSSRTFFSEGLWRQVRDSLQPGDVVMIQFGHNDNDTRKLERFVNVEGYKEYLWLFVLQTRQAGAQPILVTPVNHNNPDSTGRFSPSLPTFVEAVFEVAERMDVPVVDLNKRSVELFNSLDDPEYVASSVFMNLPPGKYPGWPEGKKDNTHFQTAGAEMIAALVFSELKRLNAERSKMEQKRN